MADAPPTQKPRLAAAAAAPDLLSSLPLDVLDNILSRLHIRAVARTSALSRAWRHRWESLPTVDLICSRGILPAVVDALLRRSAPVRAFRLGAYSGSWYVDALHDWIIYLSRNGVRDLFLWFPPHNFQLHSSLFSCRQLTSLNLTSCRLPPAPPSFAGFPCLKTLHLSKVAISEHGGRQLADLFAASPMIEEVELMQIELIGDDPDDEWVIRGPNLRELTIVSDFPYGGRIEDLPRLQEGGLFGPNYAKFLMGMAGVTKLDFFCMSNWSTEVDVLDRLPFLLKNLRSLVVAVNFTKMSEVLAIFCLFRSAPDLEELVVWGWSTGKQEIDASDDFLNAQWADGMFSKLRVVRMKQIVCLCNEFQFVEFVLSKANVLQVLSIRLGSNALCSNEEAVTYITEYPRASPDAQVIFLGRESGNTKSTNVSTENAEVEESDMTDSEHDSQNTDTDDVEVEGVQTTDSEPDSISADTDDAEVEEAQTTGSGPGPISTSTVNATVEETHTTGSGGGSTSMSHKDVEVEDAQKRCSLRSSVSMSTENTAVEEIQVTGSGLVYDVRPQGASGWIWSRWGTWSSLRRRGQLQKQMQLDLEHNRLKLESNMQEHNSFIQHRELVLSHLQDLSALVNVTLPPFPAPTCHVATHGIGDTPVNPGINGAAIAHANSPEDNVVKWC